MRRLIAVLCAILLSSLAPLTAAIAATPTPTPSATLTSTATATSTSTPTSTPLPSATSTPSPSPSPIPQGPQSNGTYCTGLLGWCPDFSGMMQGMVNGFLSWLNGILGGWLGISSSGPAPHAASATHAASTPTPSPVAAPPSGGANGLVTSVLDVATKETDYTDAAFNPLMDLFGNVVTWAQKIFGLIFVAMIVVTYLESLRHGWRAWGHMALRLLVVVFYVEDMRPLLHFWATLLGAITTSINAAGMSNFVRSLLALLAPGVDGSTTGLALGTWDLIVAIVLIALFAALVIALLYQRLVGFVMGALCFALMPLAVVALFAPMTRPAGASWIKTYIAVSLYAPLTAAAIQVLDRTVFGLLGTDPVLNNALAHAVMGLVCIGCLLAIPRLAARIAGGGIEHSVFGAPRLGQLTGMAMSLIAL